jgi:hypothetical protein
LEDQPVSGGLTPAKNSQEISKPTQITKPNRLMSQVRRARGAARPFLWPVPAKQNFPFRLPNLPQYFSI